MKYIEELFYALAGAMLIFVMLELIWPRVVLAYFNISWLLIFFLLIGIVILVKNKNHA